MATATAVRSEEAEPLLLAERQGHVLQLTMNRPAARNALSIGLMSALIEALDGAAADREARIVVIAAAGPAFCAGHDLRELRSEGEHSEGRREAFHGIFAQCSELMTRIVRLPKPVIAEVHGIATAAGCQLVASCDLAVAAADARFATPGVNIGLFCSTPMVALSRNVGKKAAMEMLLTGDMISAERARELGLVNRVVPAGELRSATAALAEQIAAKSAFTVAIGKEAFYRQAELDLAEAYRFTSEVMTKNMLGHDAGEGIDAFIEKRKPEWKDA
jgi:enoyl-CoA hydratase/carnithine racemase